MFNVELVWRLSFYAVSDLNVFDDYKMFVLEGETVGCMKFYWENCDFAPLCMLRFL